MVLSGWPLTRALVLLALWLVLLSVTFFVLLRAKAADSRLRTRHRITTAGLGLAALAVLSVLLLHLSWVSPSLSQNLGPPAIRVLSFCIFWASLAGLVLSIIGSGRWRFLGIGSCLLTTLYWFDASLVAAISMGSPLVRHPTRYLIPEGYIGWIEVHYGEPVAPALPLHDGTFVCKIPESGSATTSSPLEDGWASDEYYYYSESGPMRELKDTGWGQGGMIWAPSTTIDNKKVRLRFYVGTEEQYHRGVSSRAKTG